MDASNPTYYFVRANGDTLHNDPAKPACFVPGEPPPAGGGTYFNHLEYCLRHGVARIGWPHTDDLRHVKGKNGKSVPYREPERHCCRPG